MDFDDDSTGKKRMMKMKMKKSKERGQASTNLACLIYQKYAHLRS